MSNLDWAQPGTKALIYDTFSYTPTAWHATVLRRTATQAIVKAGRDERRFRLKDGAEVGHIGRGDYTLVPTDDQRALTALARMRLVAVRRDVGELLGKKTHDRIDVRARLADAAKVIADALADLAEPEAES